MGTAYKRCFTIFFFLLFISVGHIYAQDSCYNCSTDSLAAVLKDTKSDTKKVELLTLLSDLTIGRIATPTDTTALGYIKLLIELSKSQQVKNIDAYKVLLKALQFFNKVDDKNAQDYFKQAVALFDNTHKKIPGLLTITRITYNLVGNQEDRLQFYTDKLQYYIINGPAENIAPCYHAIGGYYLYKADYNLAISNYLKAMDLYKNVNGRAYRNLLNVVAAVYSQWGNDNKSLEYFSKVIPLTKMAKDSTQLSYMYINLSDINLSMGKYSAALLFSDTAINFSTNGIPAYTAEAYLENAFALTHLGRLNEALNQLDHAKSIADSFHYAVFSAYGPLEIDYGYYKYYSALKQYDKAGAFLLTAYKKSIEAQSSQLQLKYLKELSLFYGGQNKPALAFEYTKKFYALNNALDSAHSSFKVAQYENEEKELKQNDSLNVLKQQGAVQAATIRKNNMMLWGSLVALILISVSLFFVYRQYHLNKKTLLSLRKTQRQLIMAEKMASLGELTAGIAHEIQNPLNFVNNFSEVNKELIGEMKTEIEKGNMEEVKLIATDIETNEEKINHHGKRADAIVKGMLQHSRSSTGAKEPTDINALCDEYLRLAYHGLRAKDKTFNAAMETDFDNTIGKINIIPQDMGRVILNLIINAFYAVNEKKKMNADGYEPTVSLSTKKINGKVEINIKDNGNGIPQKVIDKIFQPFFTTKPTGEGTGLGLSLSYDIVKAHGGEIKVDTKESEGTAFAIIIPI